MQGMRAEGAASSPSSGTRGEKGSELSMRLFLLENCSFLLGVLLAQPGGMRAAGAEGSSSQGPEEPPRPSC